MVREDEQAPTTAGSEMSEARLCLLESLDKAPWDSRIRWPMQLLRDSRRQAHQHMAAAESGNPLSASRSLTMHLVSRSDHAVQHSAWCHHERAPKLTQEGILIGVLKLGT